MIKVIFFAIVNFINGLLGYVVPPYYPATPNLTPDEYVTSYKLSEDSCIKIDYLRTADDKIDILCETTESKKVIATGYVNRDQDNNIIKANNSVYIKSIYVENESNGTPKWNTYYENIAVIKPSGEKITIFQNKVINDFTVMDGINKLLVIYSTDTDNNKVAIVDDTTGEILKEYESEVLASFSQGAASYTLTVAGKREKNVILELVNHPDETTREISIDMELNTLE